MAPKCLLLFVVFSWSNGVLCCKPPPPPPTNCRVSQWHQWNCHEPCLKGKWKCERLRDIVVRPNNGGLPCPSINDTEFRSCPVDCRLGTWSNWSDCTTCGSGGRSRYRDVYQPAVFSGSPCTSTLEQIDGRCVANDTCDTDSCNTDEFKCTNGECLSHVLVCNGDDDCGDSSDEKNCGKINKTCSTDKPIPGILKAELGYDILRSDYKRGIIDNTKYAGTCAVFHSSKVDLRKPWNIEDYDDQVDSTERLSTEGYLSSQDYRNALKKKFSASFSAALDALDILSASVSLSISKETSRLIEVSASESSSFYHLQVEIKIARFTTRTRNLVLSKPFVDDIYQLPNHYDFAKYSSLFINYGTHYISSGILGGKFKHVIQYSNEKIHSSDTNDVKNCLKGEILAYILPEWNAGLTLKYCNSAFSSEQGSALSFASKIYTVVVGGSPLTRNALALSDSHTPGQEDFEAWTKSISESPDIISFELAPVTDLLPKDKREYGVQALLDYLKLYDPTNCKVSCLNKGKLVVLNEGKECRCVCPFPYYGLGCENGLKNAEDSLVG